jgi:hypothetical protein
VNHEVGGALRDGNGDVGARLEQEVGDLLEPGRVGEVGVLMKNGGQTAQRRGHPSERRRAVAVQVQDVDLLAVDDAQEVAQRHRIELRPLQVGDVDPLRLERLFRQIFLAQTDERDAETVGVEARNHPAEQALDAVHPRSFPAEVIADLQHVQQSWTHCVEKRRL